MPSPFLTPGLQSQADSLALLHLRRDQTIPTVLRTYDDENLGYDEGKVTNTRFGSFPHSTLLDQPWGAQIAASKVDTGSRGRRNPSTAQKLTEPLVVAAAAAAAEEHQKQQQLKRKADEIESPKVKDDVQPIQKAPVTASSGFLHLLYPTPESWTASLPHRTQVVYTPDYSYILHRLRVRPGCTVIEAGSGSGSFTHAAARAVFNGYPSAHAPSSKRRRFGKVCSFEFHEQRVAKVREEIQQHGLEEIVQVTHRDVYDGGFLLGEQSTGSPPKANAVFLDLPSPWLALKHLSRSPPSGAQSPLDPSTPVHICTFSPCLEQAQRTISTLRQLSWLSIEMVEVNHHRIEVRREILGLEAEGIRGATVFPKSVEEAVSKLRTIEDRARQYRALQLHQKNAAGLSSEMSNAAAETKTAAAETPAASISAVQGSSLKQIPIYEQGRLLHRTEPDLKTHTSYLVFAVLPQDWSEAEERKCREKWPSRQALDPSQMQQPKSKKQMKRETKMLRMAASRRLQEDMTESKEKSIELSQEEKEVQ